MTTITLRINGEIFILEFVSQFPHTLLDEIEIICRYAYEEDSELASILTHDGNDIWEASPAAIAGAVRKYLQESKGVYVDFHAIDADITIEKK